MSVNNETYITSMNEIIRKCETPCETRPMMGRSWYKQFGYHSPCSCAHTAQAEYRIKQEERQQLFIKNCIKRIEKTYSTNIILTPQLQEEINNMYPISSGCWFIDWLNHRLYAEVMMNNMTNEVKIPDYKDCEDLCDSDEEDE